MPPDNPTSLWTLLKAAGDWSSRGVEGARASATWGELAASRVFGDQGIKRRGSSLLLAMADQFTAAAALIELDGKARRIVLYPSDMPREYLAMVADSAAVDVILTDQPDLKSIDSRVEHIVSHSDKTGEADRGTQIETEWILLTSGTSGVPKLVVHTLASLTAAIEYRSSCSSSTTWSTFYDIHRFGGLQIFLRAALTGTSLVLKGAHEWTSDFLVRAGSRGVTHISGTPSHWRRALMSPLANRIAPAYVRLSGEIADQAILNQLRSQYPGATIAHAFASTEAGLAFEVNDGLMGVPAELIGQDPLVEMKLKDGTLRVRSDRTASGYLGTDGPTLKDAEGYVDTGDILELRDARYYFLGRRDGIINVGGLKVHPEEVEAVINRHPEVSGSLVRRKQNPITGALVVADVVLKTPHLTNDGAQALQRDIMQFCRGELALHKVPVAINFVPTLAVSEAGKLLRPHA
jgi:acyl-coenzyme A synthetase/AMP-(fatty) acid ligase